MHSIRAFIIYIALVVSAAMGTLVASSSNPDTKRMQMDLDDNGAFIQLVASSDTPTELVQQENNREPIGDDKFPIAPVSHATGSTNEEEDSADEKRRAKIMEMFMAMLKPGSNMLELNSTHRQILQKCKEKHKMSSALDPSNAVIQDAYCPESERHHIWPGYILSLDTCYAWACDDNLAGTNCGPYFYTNAVNGVKWGECKCCTKHNPTFYVSSKGNNVYQCAR